MRLPGVGQNIDARKQTENVATSVNISCSLAKYGRIVHVASWHSLSADQNGDVIFWEVYAKNLEKGLHACKKLE